MCITEDVLEKRNLAIFFRNALNFLRVIKIAQLRYGISKVCNAYSKVGRKEVKEMKETESTDASMLLSLELQDEFICEPVKFAARSGCGRCGCSGLGGNDESPGK